MHDPINHRDILQFWFEETTPAQWFSKDDAFDATIRSRFGALHAQATAGELAHWRNFGVHGRLAEIIVMDQFSRNLYRNNARQFASDTVALVLAQEIVTSGFDQKLEPTERAFIYLPYMHSESRLIHEEALLLFTDLGLQQNLDFEYKHKAIIDRFGRYPHRNEVLGRVSTEEEIEFLKLPDSHF
ncbi:MAG: DUF924 domain-containing protein [Candidatus Saccharibacteria bacterium]|nr:DUF924 domain-containing protein [Moraxellaceae bacterium]